MCLSYDELLEIVADNSKPKHLHPNHWVEWFKTIFPTFDMRVWQDMVLNPIFTHMFEHEDRFYIDGSMVAGGHGIGKTTFNCIAMMMHSSYYWAFHNTESYCATLMCVTKDQLGTTLMRESDRMRALCALPFYKTEKFIALSDKFVCDAAVWNKNNTHAMQGHHAKNTLLIIDEAEGVPELIFNKAMSFCTDSRATVIVTANPYTNDTWFSRAWEDKTWKTYNIPREDTDDDFARRIKRAYGEDSDMFRTQVLGLFPFTNRNAFFNKLMLENSAMRWTPEYRGPFAISVDVATSEGADYTVIDIWNAEKLIKQIKTKEPYLVAKDMVLDYQKRLQPQFISIDKDGCGYGFFIDIYTTLKAKGSKTKVIGVSCGSRANDSERFVNRKTELAFEARDWLMSIGAIPNDKELINELEAMMIEIVGGRTRLVPKKETHSKSPDKGDAFLLRFAATLDMEEMVMTSRQRKNMDELRKYGII